MSIGEWIAHPRGSQPTGTKYGEDDADAAIVDRVEPEYHGNAFTDAFDPQRADAFHLTGADYIHTGALLLWAATEGLPSHGKFPGLGTKAFEEGAERVTDYAEEVYRLAGAIKYPEYPAVTFDRILTALVPLVLWRTDGTVDLPTVLTVLKRATT